MPRAAPRRRRRRQPLSGLTGVKLLSIAGRLRRRNSLKAKQRARSVITSQQYDGERPLLALKSGEFFFFLALPRSSGMCVCVQSCVRARGKCTSELLCVARGQRVRFFENDWITAFTTMTNGVGVVWCCGSIRKIIRCKEDEKKKKNRKAKHTNKKIHGRWLRNAWGNVKGKSS